MESTVGARELDTVGKRLRYAIEKRAPRGSIRGFQEAVKRAMEARGLSRKGSSRAMIFRYLNDQAVPPLEFVREAARLLRVREEWLLSNEGPMDATAETVGATADATDPVRDIQQALPFLADVDMSTTGAVLDLTNRYFQLAQLAGAPDGVELGGLFKLINDSVFVPLQFFGRDAPAKVDLDPMELSDYARAILNALSTGLLMVGRGWPDPTAGSRADDDLEEDRDEHA